MLTLFRKGRIHESAIGFLIIIVLFFTIGSITISGLFTLGKLTRTIYDHPLVVSNAALNAALDITKIHRDMKDVVLSESPSEVDAILAGISRNEQLVYTHLDVIRRNILGDEGLNLEEQARKLFNDWKPIRNEVVRLYTAGEQNKAVQITRDKGARHVEKLEAKMLELTSYARHKSTQFITSAEANQARLEVITITLTGAGALFSALIAFLFVRRVIRYEARLRIKFEKLQLALDEIKTLRGIIPICSYCHHVRNDEGVWSQIELYVREHSEADFSHGICPKCMQEKFPKQYAKIQRKNDRPEGN